MGEQEEDLDKEVVVADGLPGLEDREWREGV